MLQTSPPQSPSQLLVVYGPEESTTQEFPEHEYFVGSQAPPQLLLVYGPEAFATQDVPEHE